ncbi:hypothetical protein Clacol_006609 [Clathrus columnatus]|uniref:1-(5-phosphoribosyl)-5-[(5-phosphoribosylamino)methylideneamino] imidazole-4-carboxamide isomerase n=1 Tax=Clathrus columnatus TaxID=1419009 RepID=A0AAV5AGW4_9AGAM|nr:hypothetical protein Clacol_006609 [Clathrus columnatus]
MPCRFRPCIDLHDGIVKQIVGGSLSDRNPASLKTNFVSSHSPAYYAHLFKKNNFTGGHIIKLGPGNDEAAKEALAEWPNGFHLGGGINDENALKWIEAGAEKVIVTSYLFPSCRFSLERLEKISLMVGKERLVIDLSCRRKGDKWFVAMNKWQDLTDMEINQASLDLFSQYCSEFLIHAADVEGLCQGIDEELVQNLGRLVKIPTTYAGGAKNISDLDLVDSLSGGKIDLTYGRQVTELRLGALDIFGGNLVKFDDLIKRHEPQEFD